MYYEWDENKRAANFVKHGVDFADADLFDWASAFESQDDRAQYGEKGLSPSVLSGNAFIS
ncbi:MAG: BrnT family toxin [Desulfoprunum sp.]